MSNADISLMAHLMRRAGFGATRDELEAALAKGYEATVEELLHPGDPEDLPQDVIRRYHTEQAELRLSDGAAANWMYRMITTKNPLEEKLSLFWHSLFATGYVKLNQANALLNQIEMFRKYGLGNYATLLVELSKDPAMIIWLDNNDNHKEAINENYGRELLELFSMGIGNYSEEDIKECARAFTGWTLGNAEYMSTRASRDSIWPYSRINWHFQYRDYDHDDGEKTFLGETGNFNGQDIVDIIAKQEATARFVSTRMFQYFVADEVNEDGEKVIDEMIKSYFDSGYEMRSVLRTLFNSEYFKSENARWARVKGPVELVIGAVRLAGSYREPTPGIEQVARQAVYMGQGLLQPPSVEGWHEGIEWVDSGALVERVNFVAHEFANVQNPGVRRIIERLANDNGGSFTPEALVEKCLDLIGPVEVSDATRTALLEYAEHLGEISLKDHQEGDDAEKGVAGLLSLAAATKEFQLA